MLMPTLLDELHLRYEADVPLGPLTWYGLGGRAQWLVHPTGAEQLSTLARRCHEAGQPMYVLSAGANLLVRDSGVPGVVVKLDEPAFKQVRINKNILTVGAGFDLAKLVLENAKRGLAGTECLAGIPATLGGAVRMNAGGAYGDIGKSVRSLQVMDALGQPYVRDRDDLVFAYRKTNIDAKFILKVELELTEDDPEALGKRVREIFAFKSSTQPLGAHSAGCAFKNPSPSVSAGKLIDQAGLKGFRLGGAEVSTVHANFIVAHPGCQADDILRIMEHVQAQVYAKFNVKLEREVVVWP